MRRVLGVLLLNGLVGLAVILIIMYLGNVNPTENTQAKCTNNKDDDGDKLIDLDDPDCQELLKDVVVAASNLEPKVLQRGDMSVDRRFVRPDDAFEGTEALIGKRLCDVLSKGEYIRKSHLVGGLECVTPKQKRAMAIKVDKVRGVVGFIKAGDHVDVLVKLKKSASLVLQNIPVLAIGASLEPESDEKKSSERKDIVVTLEVSPDESLKLASALSQGTLYLVMRNSTDTSELSAVEEVIECMGSECVQKWVNN